MAPRLEDSLVALMAENGHVTGFKILSENPPHVLIYVSCKNCGCIAMGRAANGASITVDDLGLVRAL